MNKEAQSPSLPVGYEEALAATFGRIVATQCNNAKKKTTSCNLQVER